MFRPYFDQIKKLEFTDDPDYEKLKMDFRDRFLDHVNDGNQFTWTAIL